MNDRVFVDSNIWLYALIETQQKEYQFKHEIAKELIHQLTNIQVSTQIVNEVTINLMRKADKVRKADKDSDFIYKFLRDFLAAYTVHDQTTDDLLTAASLRSDYSSSYWDSLIVASAIRCQCYVLYSEDMQDGLCVYDDLQIINPFKTKES